MYICVPCEVCFSTSTFPAFSAGWQNGASRAVKKVSILSSHFYYGRWRGTKFSLPYIHTHTHPGGLFFQNQGRSSSIGLIIETIGKQIKWIRPFKNPHSLHSIEIRKRLPRDSWISIPLLVLGSHTNTKLVFDFLEPTWTFMRLRWRRCAKNIKEWGIHTTYHQLLLTEINCGSPGILPNGWLEGQKTTLHAVVTFRCQEGMTFEGPSYRTICLADGRWSHPLPRCYGKFFDREKRSYRGPRSGSSCTCCDFVYLNRFVWRNPFAIAVNRFVTNTLSYNDHYAMT